MKRKYKLNQGLIAFILILSLFLQSCGYSSDQLISQNLANKEFTAEGGHIVTLHEQDGLLQTDAEINSPKGFNTNYGSLPVYEGASMVPVELMHLNRELQKQAEEMKLFQSDQQIHRDTDSSGLKEGMKRKQQQKKNEQEFEKRARIDNGSRYQTLLELATREKGGTQFDLGERAYQNWQQYGSKEARIVTTNEGGMPLDRSQREISAIQNNLDSIYPYGQELCQYDIEPLNNQEKQCIATQNSVAQDYQEVFAWCQEASKQGDTAAQNTLGNMYYYGQGVVQDYQEAFKWYQKAASQGDIDAQTKLGSMYYCSQGVWQNYQEAFNWYKKAAEQGSAVAQNNLGFMYKNGQGVAQNYQEALKWYRKAAEQGSAGAQNNLGSMYKNGQGVVQDYQEAFKWYQKAAERENAAAQNNLGFMYQYGQGVVQDYQEAFNWYKKAVKQGSVAAQNNLGFMYYYGQGVAQNYQEAVRWYQKAAEQGHEVAQRNLRFIVSLQK